MGPGALAIDTTAVHARAPLVGVMLGAGRPVRGDEPAAMAALPLGGGRALDWLISTLRPVTQHLTFVAGYRAEAVVANYPDLAVVLNAEWKTTGPVASLLRAMPAPGHRALVTYVDVVYRPALVKAVGAAVADVVLGVDRGWRSRYSARGVQDALNAEVVCWPPGQSPSGFGPARQFPDGQHLGEYTGLVQFSARALGVVQALAAEDPSVLHWRIPALFAALSARGLDFLAIDAANQWAEFNAPQDVARFVCGTKAETLERLAPLVRNCSIGRQVRFTVSDWRQAPEACLQAVQSAFSAVALVVRSSALSEDGFEGSMAGRYASVLNVAGSDPRALADAVRRVVASYGNPADLDQVLVQPYVGNMAVAGVAMTRTLSHGAPYRVLNYDDTGHVPDAVTSGRGAELRTVFLHRDSVQLPAAASPCLAPVVQALREIEALVGYDSLDVEFILDQQGVVHVVQVRPIAVDHGVWQPDDVAVSRWLARATADWERLQTPGLGVVGRSTMFSRMSDWNPAEILGSRPRALAFSLYEEVITRGVWARQRREFGYRDLGDAPLMFAFAGHAYIDVRASLNSFVPAGLATHLAARLVERGLQQLHSRPDWHDKLEFEVALTCFDLDFENRANDLAAEGFLPSELAALRTALQGITRHAVARVEADFRAIDDIQPRHDAIVALGLDPLRTAVLLVEHVRERDTCLFAHLARSAFVATSLLRSGVHQGLYDDEGLQRYLSSVHTVAAEVAADLAALHAGALTSAAFLQRHGHLRPGTYELTVPCYAEAPDVYLGRANPLPACTSEDANPHVPLLLARALSDAGVAVDSLVMDRFLRMAIAGREAAKHAFSRLICTALEQLALFGQAWGFDREQLSHLRWSDFTAAAQGHCGPDLFQMLAARSAEGRQSHGLAQLVELPDVLLAAEDFQGFMQAPSTANYVGRGKVRAPVVVVDGGHTEVALAGAVVLIRQADPGHDWVFSHRLAGLVTAYGGANSHMAVRAAEFGLPAAIGVGEHVWQTLASSDVVEIDCAQRKVSPWP